MPQIITGTFSQSANTLDDVYIAIQTPQQVASASGSSRVGGAPGFATWGSFNTSSTIANDAPSLARQYGPPSNSGYDVVREGAFFLAQQPLGGFRGVRVGNGTQTAATGALSTIDPTTINTTYYLSATGTVATNDTITISIGNTSSGHGGHILTVTSTSTSLVTLYNSIITALNADSIVSTGYTASLTNSNVIQISTKDGSQIGTLLVTPSDALQFAGSRASQAGAFLSTFGPANPLNISPVGSSNATAITLSGYFPGTLGNQIVVGIESGSRSTTANPSFKVIVQCAQFTPEVFDNIPQGTSPTLSWTAINNAINNGFGAQGSSQFVTSVVTSPASQPAPGFYVTLSGGTDGIPTDPTTIKAILIGQDGTSGARTGMYALDGSKIDAIWLCGLRDSSAGPTIQAFADSQNCVGFVSLALQTGYSQAQNYITDKVNALLDDPFIAVTAGDHWFYDSFLGQNINIPQCAAFAGLSLSIDPSESPGNRQFIGLVGTDITYLGGQRFGTTDMGRMEAAGILFTEEIPSGAVLGARHGRNSSSNSAINELAYSFKINDIARTFATGGALGQFVNRLQTTQANDPLRAAVCVVIDDVLQPQKTNYQIDDYSRQCDLGNNSIAMIRAKQCRADVRIQFMSVISTLAVNVIAGQTVDVTLTGVSAVNTAQ